MVSAQQKNFLKCLPKWHHFCPKVDISDIHSPRNAPMVIVYIIMYIYIYTAIVHDPLQPVVRPVRTKEHVKVRLPSRTAIVPTAPLELTAS